MKKVLIWKFKALALLLTSAGMAFLLFQPMHFMYDVLRLLEGQHHLFFAMWELFVPISAIAGGVLTIFALGLFIQEFLGYPILRKTWKWLKTLDK